MAREELGHQHGCRGWLRSLGLERYEAAFRENGIDLSVLPDLTDQDLEKLGVLLGHRRKLQRAIANLEGEASEKRAPLVAVVAAAPAAQHPPDTAERRQVTVMFSDLVGSTALSTRMDPLIADIIGKIARLLRQLAEGRNLLRLRDVAQANENSRC